MFSVLVIVLEVGREDSARMVFAKDNNVIGALAANAAVKPFDVGMLPGAVVCRDNFFNTH